MFRTRTRTRAAQNGARPTAGDLAPEGGQGVAAVRNPAAKSVRFGG
ncbi:hypothetical protein ACIQZO_09795 [Streptomyces sp. NPDC097617]